MSPSPRGSSVGWSPDNDTSEEALRDERLTTLLNANALGQAYLQLQDTVGWKDFSERLQTAYATLQSRLQTAALSDVPSLQAQIQVVKNVMEIVPAGIKAGKEAHTDMLAMAKESFNEEERMT